MSNEHLGGCYPQGDSNTLCWDVFGYLLVKYEVKSILDCGCGYGHALKWFSEHGLCAIKGIEGWDEAVNNTLVPGAIIHHDFTKGPAPLAQPFDLAWCAEFVEHVDEQYIPNYMQALKLARHVVITHAEPGQAGHHHVTLHSTKWWVAKFAEFGFDWDEQETNLLRRTDRWRSGWGRRTLCVFHQQ
jgi:SAM-dependent methyltransferase